MTQSSDAYAVANGSGAAVRAALNADLQAANSNNSGTSGPASTVAAMDWADTTTGLVKQRDSSNASWIKVRKLNGDASVDVASATTTDIGADGAKNIRITGTTTITSLGSSAPSTDTPYFVRFSGALTLTHNGTSLILPGAANITTAAGDAMLAMPLGSGNWQIVDYTRATGKPIVAAAVSGSVVQIAVSETGAVSSGTTVVPFDDTIPQNTEGDQYMSLSFTTINASSTWIIDVVIFLGASTSQNLTAALFQDSTANALAGGIAFVGAGGQPEQICFRHKMAANTGAATTFKVRAGGSGAGTTTFNGAGGSRLLGGVLASSITVTEILP